MQPPKIKCRDGTSRNRRRRNPDSRKVEIEQLDTPVTVYNFEVADWHTYYVSEEAVLVHNMCMKPTSPNQMQNQVKEGRAPRGISRVDIAHTPDGQPHIHFGDNYAALNMDGTWHDAGKKIPTITNRIKKWLLENGWNLPEE